MRRLLVILALLASVGGSAWAQLPIDQNREWGGKWFPHTGTTVRRDGTTGAPTAILALQVQLNWTALQATAENTTVVHAASTGNETLTTGIGTLSCARNLSVTYGGTANNTLAVGPTIYGLDMVGASISEALPAATVNTTGTKYGAKCFSSVTSIVVPVLGASTTIAIGTGSKLGIPFKLPVNTVTSASINGTIETTAPTVTVDSSVLSNNGITLNATLNGTAVSCFVKVP